MVRVRPCLLLVLILGASLFVNSVRAQTTAGSQQCAAWVARLVSWQGSLAVRRPGVAGTQPASLRQNFCVGDVLEVGAYSRAALELPDQTVVSVDQGTVITFAAPADDKRTWLDILKGAIHVISRDPRALRVITPFANAGIEGTEFFVGVGGDATTVIVYEGSVKVENSAGAATAAAGESVLAKAGSAPVLQQIVRPRDAVVWTLYYPPTATGPLPDAAAPEPAVPSVDFHVGRAEQRLRVGRMAEADADLASALSLAPGSAEVLARQSVIALTRNQTETAAGLADEAVASAPDSAAARLARSYTRQAALDLPGAISDLEAGAAAHPDNALLRARLAELWLASGEIARSEAEAKAALAADPQLGLAHSVLGFVYLARLDINAGRDSFMAAMQSESNAPLPRLGLGLVQIREGDLEAGRKDLELAVILDPDNSLIRSYVGKAYYEEKRDDLAASQFSLAKTLDPNDPTPWYYEAFRKLAANQPVEALNELRQSVALNDNRAVYRSRLLLDDDAAARNAGVSAIYDELGFEGMAVREGTEALADSFGNSSAHRLLANAYAALPRYDISRVSEAFQAQVRQPLSVPPLELLTSSDNVAILRTAGPSRVGLNEFDSLFNRDQLLVRADVMTGSRGTSGDQFIASGLEQNIGFAVGQMHYETDGFRGNNAAKRDVYDGFLQFEVSPATSLQVDANHSEFELGYTFYEFDESNSFPVTIDEEADALRFNGRHATSPGDDWIWTLGYEDRQRDIIYPVDASLVTRTKADTWIAELQRLDQWSGIQVISGVGYIKANEDFPIEQGAIDTYDANAYVYGQWQVPALDLSLTGGLALDLFKAKYDFGLPAIDREQLSPKLGLVWSPTDGTTVRGAAFTSLRRPFIGGQTLEPTQVASFNQFFTGLEQFYGDPEGTVSRRVGLAVDQALSASAFAGIEAALRKLEVPSVILDADTNWREKSARIYLYKTFVSGRSSGFGAGLNTALSVAGEYEHIDRPQINNGSEGINMLETIRVPFGASLSGQGGFSLRLVTSYVRQEGDFAIDTSFPVVPKTDDGWITDVLLEYRLPRRLGSITLGARNVFDVEVDVIETDPLSPRVATRRLVSGSVSIEF
jgi:tetratricopeptide (TPR) repeat protein